MSLNPEAVTDATLELCDLIVTEIEESFDTVELCESIVAQIEMVHELQPREHVRSLRTHVFATNDVAYPEKRVTS